MSKFSNTKKRVAILLLIAVVLTLLMPYYNSFDFTTAQKPQIKKEGITSADSSTFVVLEIVPDKAYANFGYNVAGQEPVSIQKVVDAGKVNDLMTKFTIDGKQKVFTRVTEYSSLKKTGFVQNSNTQNKTTITFPSGYYKKVAEGTGEFILSEYQFVANASGNYIFVEAENKDGVAIKQFQNDQVWVQNETIEVSQLMYKKESVMNNDYFRKISLNNPNAKVLVETVTPDTLNTQINNNKSYLDNVDMIVISDNKTLQSNMVSLWNTYAKPSGDANHVVGKTFVSETDLSWKTTYQIFRRVIGLDGESIPITYDTSILSADTGKSIWSRNTDKLYLMLKKLNPIAFYNIFLNDNTSGGGQIQNIKIDSEGKYINGTWETNWSEGYYKPDPAFNDAYGYKFDKLADNLGINVQDNVYCYNGNGGSVQFLDKIANDSSVTKSALTDGFFNFILKNRDKFEVDASASSTSPAYVLKYMIGYTAKSLSDSKTMANVLDIEPCYYFTKTIFDFRKMMPMCSASITITKQTSSAFNGKIGNLNNDYDLIYLGLNVDAAHYNLYTDTTKNITFTTYNDSKLNGKVYLHVGDLVIGPTSNERYPAWDYTSGFYDDWAQDAVNWLIGDTTASNQLRMPGNDITKRKAAELKAFLNAGYPIIVNPTLYNASSENASLKAEAKQKVDYTSNIFKFIESNNVANLISENDVNKSSTKRTDKYLSVIKPSINLISKPKEYVGTETEVLNNPNSLYVNGADTSNRTLVFKYQIMDNSSTDTTNYSAMLYVDRNADGRFLEGEKIRQRDNLSKGVYTLSVALGEEYMGAITWKLVVVNANNHGIRAEKTGTCAVCNSQSQKKVIRILQVNNKESTLNLSTNAGFRKYTNSLRDYTLHITVMTKEEFEVNFGGFKYWEPETTDQLVKYFDMLIFGFRDAFDGPDAAGRAIQNVTYFMQQGKCVLFTHDVTSLVNLRADLFGFGFNKHLRGYLGIDRFGARIKNGDISGMKANDTATSPYQADPYHSIHGYAVWALRRLGGRKIAQNPVPIYPNFTYDNGTNGSGLGITTKVNKINTGQVTQYPYLINDDFTVAPTHGQSYQLDMEDPNVTVWYTLADDGLRPSGFKVPNASGEIYGISPSDASNNYYIYNKGNITYSSVGHSAAITTEEIKLFVNTMIAAYKASVQSPIINIENSDIIESGNKYYIYVDQNYAKPKYTANNFFDIKFTPYVNSLLSENMSCVVNYKGMTGEAPIYNEAGNLVTDTIANREGKLVKSDYQYMIKYPLNLLNDPLNNEITIKIQNEKGLTGTVTITLLRRSLFDLD